MKSFKAAILYVESLEDGFRQSNNGVATGARGVGTPILVKTVDKLGDNVAIEEKHVNV